MESIISNLGHFISDHRVWAGPIVGVIAFGDSLAIIGMFIPASPIMIAIGGADAEEMFYGRRSTGSRNDFEQA